MNEKYYVKYHVHHGDGNSPIVMYCGPIDHRYKAEREMADIRGYTDISDCHIITQIQFELDQTMNNQESS